MQSSTATTLKAGLALLLFVLFCGLSGYFLNPWSSRNIAPNEQQPPPDWSNLDANLGLRPIDGSDGTANNGIGGNGSAPVTPLGQVTVRWQGQTSTVDSGDLYARQVVQTQTETGATAYLVEYDELGANALVNQLWQEYATAEVQSSLRNPSVALQPGAVLLQAETETFLGWQEISVTLDFNEQGTAFAVGAVSVGGLSFNAASAPEPLAGLLTELEREGNAALNTAVFLDPSGQLSIEQIYITDNLLRLIAN